MKTQQTITKTETIVACDICATTCSNSFPTMYEPRTLHYRDVVINGKIQQVCSECYEKAAVAGITALLAQKVNTR